MNRDDREILRALAHEKAALAALPEQGETVALWKAINSLKPVRPMLMIDQIPWHEMNVDDELTCRCGDGYARAMETALRRELYAYRHLRADRVVSATFEVDPAGGGLDFGYDVREETLATDGRNDVVSHQFEDQLGTWEAVDRIADPAVSYDAAETERRLSQARDAFGDILDVRRSGITLNLSIWDRITTLRGADALILDLVDRPDFTHAMMKRMAAVYDSYMTQLESLGLLSGCQPVIHCSGGHTDELPQTGYDPARPRLRDAWAFGMSQIFSTVSPAMHDEFEIEYAIPLYERMGLMYYGCCEPLHRKIDIIRRLPHVRKISMSPWADPAMGAERMGGDYVLSHKPNPAFLATDALDEGQVRAELMRVRDAAHANGTPHEFILKDISTVRYDPRKLWRWAELVMDFVRE